MRPILLSFVAVIVAGAALAGGIYLREQVNASGAEIITVKPSKTDNSQAGRRPEFWLPDPEGQRHSVSEWDGKLLVINFWATWCPPCLHEIPVFIALQEHYRSRGVQFLGIAIDDGENVRAFAAEVGLNYPTLHGQADAMEVMSAYGNKTGGLPFTVLVGPSGSIVARHPGVLEEPAATALLDGLL